jgi:tetratricopeptide (TPR) repeat protein
MKLLQFISIFVAALGLLAQPARELSLQRAQTARDAGRLPEAIAAYEAALRLQPRDGETLWYLALCQYDAEQFRQSAATFQRLLTLEPGNNGARAFLGIAQFRMKDFANAQRHLAQARIQGVPAIGDLALQTAFHLLLVLNKNGNFDLAGTVAMDMAMAKAAPEMIRIPTGISALRLAMLPEEVPEPLREPVYLAGEALVRTWNKEPAVAQEARDKLLANHAAVANVHYLEAYIRSWTSAPGAVDMWKEELRVSPRHVEARTQIAYELLKQGDAAAALPFVQQAAQLEPKNFVVRNVLGRILLAQDKPQAALPELLLAAQLAPTSPECHFHLASAYQRLGRKADAQRHRTIFEKLSGGNKQP